MSYYTDMTYEFWRSGHNPDLVDRDRARDYEYDGWSAREAARREMALEDQRIARRREQWMFEEGEESE